MAKIWIDAGHGGHDPGAVNGKEREKDYNLEYALALEIALKALGHEVGQSRTTDVYLYINDRAKKANAWKADIFISIHCNSFSNVGANGLETLYNTKSANGKKLAQALQDGMLKQGVYNSNRGIKPRSDLGVLNGTSMPAALIELAFISNSKDLELLKKKKDLFIKGIVEGIQAYFGLKNNVSIPKHEEDTKPPNNTEKSVNAGTVNTASLNVRSGVGVSHKIVRSIKQNETVSIYEVKNGWFRIGSNEWVNGSYIKIDAGDKKSKYYEKGKLKIIETTADNIYLQAIPGVPLHNIGAYGMSGTFQDTGKAERIESIWSIAVNAGKPLGPNAHTNSIKGYKRGTMICYADGSVEVLRINELKEVKKPIKWAIGGGSLSPFYNPPVEGFVAPFDDVLRNTYHAGIAHKGNKIFLIVSRPCTMGEFRSLVENSLSIDGAVFLDGGGTTQMYYENGRGLKQFRKLSHMIGLREV